MSDPKTAGLSRSASMARFTDAVGCSPMVALRQLRIRQASNLLTANVLSIEQIAHAVGYSSRSSFSRVLRRAFGSDSRCSRLPTTREPDVDQRDSRLILSGPIG
ncbi:helix-turn-helix domain-containing protein [Reyranella soli]|uniref:helix-turn-helix domain-containing protein n=1 Tax=Reyranella soli TaxID=1230389 RepID=UPI0035A25614